MKESSHPPCCVQELSIAKPGGGPSSSVSLSPSVSVSAPRPVVHPPANVVVFHLFFFIRVAHLCLVADFLLPNPDQPNPLLLPNPPLLEVAPHSLVLFALAGSNRRHPVDCPKFHLQKPPGSWWGHNLFALMSYAPSPSPPHRTLSP